LSRSITIPQRGTSDSLYLRTSGLRDLRDFDSLLHLSGSGGFKEASEHKAIRTSKIIKMAARIIAIGIRNSYAFGILSSVFLSVIYAL